jgi:flagellar biosynthetic protein FliQ
MTEREVLDISRHCIVVTLQLALPVLLFGLIAGVLVSIFQAVTQIQEFTLTFVPKLLAVIGALVIFGPWMLSTMVSFIVTMFSHMPPVTRYG